MSYHDQLALRIAEVMARQPLPGVRQLKEVRRIRLELYLMANGTLTRARVMTSSGIESMDSAAYRAALAASPYPEPPRGKKGKGGEERFEVDVEVTPRSATGVRG
jgi:protein TonB